MFLQLTPENRQASEEGVRPGVDLLVRPAAGGLLDAMPIHFVGALVTAVAGAADQYRESGLPALKSMLR